MTATTQTAEPITNALLDQLQDEMRDMAVNLRAEARVLIEDDDVRANRDLADAMQYIADNRPLLVRFAFTLRNSKTRTDAIAALVSA